MQANYPKLSADVAGSRKFDVYMGIDVFGRGTYGGGQWTVSILKVFVSYIRPVAFLCQIYMCYNVVFTIETSTHVDLRDMNNLGVEYQLFIKQKR